MDLKVLLGLIALVTIIVLCEGNFRRIRYPSRIAVLARRRPSVPRRPVLVARFRQIVVKRPTPNKKMTSSKAQPQPQTNNGPAAPKADQPKDLKQTIIIAKTANIMSPVSNHNNGNSHPNQGQGHNNNHPGQGHTGGHNQNNQNGNSFPSRGPHSDRSHRNPAARQQQFDKHQQGSGHAHSSSSSSGGKWGNQHDFTSGQGHNADGHNFRDSSNHGNGGHNNLKHSADLIASRVVDALLGSVNEHGNGHHGNNGESAHHQGHGGHNDITASDIRELAAILSGGSKQEQRGPSNNPADHDILSLLQSLMGQEVPQGGEHAEMASPGHDLSHQGQGRRDQFLNSVEFNRLLTELNLDPEVPAHGSGSGPSHGKFKRSENGNHLFYQDVGANFGNPGADKVVPKASSSHSGSQTNGFIQKGINVQSKKPIVSSHAGLNEVQAAGLSPDNPMVIKAGQNINVAFKIDNSGQPSIVIGNGRQGPPKDFRGKNLKHARRELK